jgi:hypothetical protein
VIQSPVLRELRHSLAQASDAQILRVVATVDGLADRRSADQLVAPLRPRLGQLRPPRPLRFARLLFLPLGPVIIPASQWRLGGESIPRSAVQPIAAAVRAALGGAPAVTELIAGRLVGDTDIEAAAGALLWTPAAKILSGMEALHDWEAFTGLPEPAWLEIKAKIVGLLLIAERIWGAGAPALATPAAVEGLLKDVQTDAPLAMSAVLTVLLAIGRNLRHVLVAAARHSDRLAALSSAAVVHTLEAMPAALEAKIGRAQAQDAADEADRAGAFLAAAEASGMVSRAKIRLARQAVVAQCADRFARGVDEDVLAPLLTRDQPPNDQEMTQLEETARALHRIEAAGRGLGGGAQLDGPMNQAWKTLSRLPAEKLDPIDRARVAEILFGSDLAATMLPAF